MPIYDYHCDHCGHAFSAVQSYTDSTLEICPSCGKQPRKLMATPAIVFKGGGWYKTDSRVAPKDGPADGAKESGDSNKKMAPTATTEAAMTDRPKTDSPKAGAPKTDNPKAGVPKADKAAPAVPKGDAASS